MDKLRANTAVAHKLARMVYDMLTRGEAFVDKGQQHYEEQQRQRSVAALKRRAAALGSGSRQWAEIRPNRLGSKGHELLFDGFRNVIEV
jgi:hypothetical protein